MNDLDELEEYIEKTEDVQLGMMVEIVREYGNEIPGIIKNLKELHTGDEERNKAEMIFSTVHRAKGTEYDVVHLVNDFINESDLENPNSVKQEGVYDTAKLNEEINLLYVAITRTKNKLHIPETLMPKKFPSSPFITVIKPPEVKTPEAKAEVEETQRHLSIKEIKEKAYSVVKKRETHKDAYKPWSPELDEELKLLYESDNPISAIAEHFGRTKGAILSRLRKLNYFSE